LDRPIKVGYVSPDFFTHSVSYFIEGILANHSKTNFVIYWFSPTSSSLVLAPAQVLTLAFCPQATPTS